MKVSIITAHLECNNYVEDYNASLKAQTFKNFEIIMENDDPENPAGVSAMRNRALSKATGDYIFFLDADDYLDPTALEKAVACAEANPGKAVRVPFLWTRFRYDTVMGVARNAEFGKEQLIRPETFCDTCLGHLIPFETVKDLRFNEDQKLFADFPYIAQVYNRVEVVLLEEYLYYKRKHNDPVNYPSLDQLVVATRFADYAKSLRMAADYLDTTDRIGHYVARFAISRIIGRKVPKSVRWSDDEIMIFCELIRDYGGNIIRQFHGQERRLLKRMMNLDVKGVRKSTSEHYYSIQIFDFLKSRHQRRKVIYHRIYLKKPVEPDTVFFSTFYGRAYADSPRAIYEYMLEHYPDKKYVWLINDDSIEIPGNPIRIKSKSIKYMYYCAVAGLWVTNTRQPKWYIKRKGTKLLQCWHGTPLKRLVFDMGEVFGSQSGDYKKFFYQQACEWDYLISDNAFSTNAFHSAFKYPKEKMLEAGYPRNDLLFGDDKEERALKLKQKLGLPTDKKLVLYAPTWRDDQARGNKEYGFELKFDLKKMAQLKDEYFFILRMHYFISDNLELTDEEKEYVADYSKYNDIGELYLMSDVIITDYSSVFFDFANLRRPMLFFVYDLEDYRDTLHGFYFNMEEGCPGPMLKTNEEVIDALKNIDKIEAQYKEQYDKFCEEFCSLDDGHAAERVVKAIL